MAKQWLVLCGLTLAILGCRSNSTSVESQGPVVVITDANFETDVGSSEKPVLIGFYAPDDEGCKAVAGVAATLAAEFKDKAVVGLMDVKKNPVNSQRYSNVLPTFVLFKQGQPIELLPGEVKEDQLRSLLKISVGD